MQNSLKIPVDDLWNQLMHGQRGRKRPLIVQVKRKRKKLNI